MTGKGLEWFNRRYANQPCLLLECRQIARRPVPGFSSQVHLLRGSILMGGAGGRWLGWRLSPKQVGGDHLLVRREGNHQGEWILMFSCTMKFMMM